MHGQLKRKGVALMFSISFIFKPGKYDDEFHRLDTQIQETARLTPGFLRSETWVSPDGALTNAVYYWSDLDHLRDFSRDANHLQAKSEYSRWYDGYQIVVAKVTATYGDGRLDHLSASG